MKTPRMVNAMGNIDDELITSTSGKGNKKNRNWIKWSFMFKK